jgi:hypothetical protein
MNETARAFSAKEVSVLIGDHIRDFLDGGPDREAEDVELGQAVGLKVERISGRWNDARDYLLHTPPAPRETLKAAKEPDALPAQNEEAEKVASVDSARAWRRPLPPEPAEERLALLERLKPKEAKEPLFISPPTQPRVEEKTKPQPDNKALTTITQPLAFQHSKSPAGIPASLENAITAITKLDIDCRYDVFHDRIIVKGHECGVNGDAL